jgi:hypothetical protein
VVEVEVRLAGTRSTRVGWLGVTVLAAGGEPGCVARVVPEFPWAAGAELPDVCGDRDTAGFVLRTGATSERVGEPLAGAVLRVASTVRGAEEDSDRVTREGAEPTAGLDGAGLAGAAVRVGGALSDRVRPPDRGVPAREFTSTRPLETAERSGVPGLATSWVWREAGAGCPGAAVVG